MGRPPKNPNHPLIRLRRALSTPGREMTREDLAKKTGIPAASLRDIERSEYGMSDEIIAKISIATAVDHNSLMNGDDPLRDNFGAPLSSNSAKLEDMAEILVDKATLAFLVSVALDAAAEKGASYQFQFLLQGWLCKTSKMFGLDKLITERLTAELGSFKPGIVPPYFWPRDVKSKILWEEFGKELLTEQESIYADRLAHDPKKAARRKRLDGPPKGDPEEVAFEKEYQHDLWECGQLALQRCKDRRVNLDKSTQAIAFRPKRMPGKRSPSPARTKVG
jgi:hypothetical protein